MFRLIKDIYRFASGFAMYVDPVTATTLASAGTTGGFLSTLGGAASSPGGVATIGAIGQGIMGGLMGDGGDERNILDPSEIALNKAQEQKLRIVNNFKNSATYKNLLLQGANQQTYLGTTGKGLPGTPLREFGDKTSARVAGLASAGQAFQSRDKTVQPVSRNNIDRAVGTTLPDIGTAYQTGYDAEINAPLTPAEKMNEAIAFITMAGNSIEVLNNIAQDKGLNNEQNSMLERINNAFNNLKEADNLVDGVGNFFFDLLNLS